MKRAAARRAAFALLHSLALAAAPETNRRPVGGGILGGGLTGDYFADDSLAGAPSFTRKDLRIDFDWGRTLAPGGSRSAGFREVGHERFSVRWSGRLAAAFSETYSFTVEADDGARFRVRKPGAAWTTLIDRWRAPGSASAQLAMTAGEPVEVQLEYRQSGGPALVRLLWSSPSTPREVIDSAVQVGVFVELGGSAWLDLVKGARDEWQGLDGRPPPPMDASGWPQGDAEYVFQESLNQGLDLDPLMRGRVRFSFHGKAEVSLHGNVESTAPPAAYSAATNTTSGTFRTAARGANATYFIFRNSHRDGRRNGAPGIADLRLMRPVAPDADQAWPAETPSSFTPELESALAHYTLIRFQSVANQQRDFGDRTLPGWFNQAGGSITRPPLAIGEPSHNGPSWEMKVMLANETGRDLMISLPLLASGRTPADVDSYLYKLACLLRYGSDGREPYPRDVAAPAYPPLNPNLRVYFELENELWNTAGVFYTDYANLNALAAADAAAGNEDFAALNFDGRPAERDARGEYRSIQVWRLRKIVQRLRQAASIFAAVFGAGALTGRVRPVYEWQYANANDTAAIALEFADLYYNDGDGRRHVADPQPVSAWLWGGGGATYYGAARPNGVGAGIEGDFERPAIPFGYSEAPAGGPWIFAGAAGLAAHRIGDDIAPAFDGRQVGYLTSASSMSLRFSLPQRRTSGTYAIALRAVNRSGDGEAIRILVDGDDLTARTFSQPDGVRPPAFDAAHPWAARNVFWSASDYYASKTFSGAPGSTHTLALRGAGDAGKPQIAFIDDVRLASVDDLFAGGIPAGGEATGQTAGEPYAALLRAEADWARAFGLEALAYEGGWSLGGDDGGSPLQLTAKYADPRAREAQVRSLDMFHRAGGAVSVLGTYRQWPSWAEPWAEEGLLHPGSYPLVQAVDDVLGRLAPAPTNGAAVPASLPVSSAALVGDGHLGGLKRAGAWMSWNLLVPRAGNWTFTALLSGESAALLVDDRHLLASGAADAGLRGTLFLTAGLHTVKIRNGADARLRVSRIEVAEAAR
jgi:hypothetical protein